MKSFMPFIIIAICVGMYFVYISPSGAEVKALSREKAGYDNILNKTKELKKQREDILTVYNGIAAGDIDRLNKIVPENFSAVLFLNDLTAQAGQYGMTIRDFKTSEPKSENGGVLVNPTSGEPYTTTVVHFNVIAPYSQFVKFLTDLESSLRLIDVVGLSVRASSVRIVGDSSLEYSLEVKTYSLR
jgi:Tfp pilus assembly protein PilO